MLCGRLSSYLKGSFESPAATMSSVQALREFVNERLSAAAGELVTVFEQIVVQHEEEIDRQRKLLQMSGKLQIALHRTESPQQHIEHQKTTSSLEKEKHGAPHVKEENLVEMRVADGESENSFESVGNFTAQRLTAAAGEISTVVEQTIVQYKKEIDRQHRLLETIWQPHIKLYRTELPQHRDCTEEQLLKLEANYCLEQKEPEPPQIKEEQEGAGLLQLKEEQEELEPLQFKKDQEEPQPLQTEEHKDLSTNQEGEQLILKFESDSFKVPSIQEQLYLSEPEEAPNTEEFVSHNSEVHVVMKQTDSDSTRNAELKRISAFQRDRVDKYPVSENKAECEKLLGEEPCGKILLKKHQNLRTATDKKKNVCEDCGRNCKWPSVLLVHMRSHTGEKPFPCKTCSKRFSKKSALSIHIRTHTGERPYSCATCGKSFKVQSALRSHMRIHTSEKPYTCETCGKSFRVNGSLLCHMRSHTGAKPYPCETCGKCFRNQSDLRSHTRLHTGEKPYSCATCRKSFREQSTLRSHRRIHTGEKPYTCETCGKSFSVNSSLLSHMRSHTGAKPYPCETCGKCFRYLSGLRSHMRLHTGEKPYSCATCGKSFSEQSALRSHMRIHTGEKPYSCGTCGKSFSKRCGLLSHTRTHTGEKPYSCETCDRSFSQKSSLRWHMKIHTG